MAQCPLCSNIGKLFYNNKRTFYRCSNCEGIFVDQSLLPDNKSEKERYLQHNNDVNDINYQKFVSPITAAVFAQHTQTDTGLDFGAGTGPVIAKILKDNNYNIVLYDPFFHNTPELLNTKYDYIVCCEVIEHFHNPHKEFRLLSNLLLNKGTLYCMTEVYNDQIDFNRWYYKNDFTHVFIYTKKTLHWIKKEFNFSEMEINGNFITLTK